MRDRRGGRPYSFHGLTALRRAVKLLGTPAIDERTEIGRALLSWRRDLIADLGGPEVITTQQLTLVDIAMRSKVLLDSVDDWLLRQPSLVSYRHKTLFPVVVQRQSIANGLAHYLSLLGLERRGPKPVSLSEYLSTRRDTGGQGRASETSTTPDEPERDPG
jgi:hypothetical protein